MENNTIRSFLVFLVFICILTIFSGCVDEPTTASPTANPTASPTASPTEIIELILITDPSNKALVPERPLVEGMVNNLNAEVWVIVHPMEVSGYWVQPPVTVMKDGTWRVMIYIGRSGTIDVGKQFEIIAVANPKVKLNEGDQLRGWPEAQWKSDIILVTRQ